MAIEKFNARGWPRYAAQSGKLQINVADYDGKLTIGTDAGEFNTIWEAVGSDRVRAYNDGEGIVGVSVQRGAPDWPGFAPENLSRLNFTSRSRNASTGDLIVYVNEHGKYLLCHIDGIQFPEADVQLLEITYVTHAAPEAIGLRATIGSSYLTSKDASAFVAPDADPVVANSEIQASTSGASIKPDLLDLTASLSLETFDLYEGVARAATAAEQSLGEFIGASVGELSADHGGSGHNRPPPDILIDEDVREEAFKVLRDARSIRLMNTTNLALWAGRARDFLIKVANGLWHWVEPKFSKFFESFLEQSGKTLGSKISWAALGVVATGQITTVVDLLNQLLAMFG